VNTWDTLAAVRERFSLENAKADEKAREKLGMRKEPRYTVRGVPATFIIGEQELAVGLRNISLSGALLADLPETVDVGQSGVLTAQLAPYGTLVVACDVVHRSQEDGDTAVGVRFSMVSREDINRMLFFLHHQWEQTMAREGNPVPVESW